MSGADWLILILLGGVFALLWIVDELRVMDRRQLEQQAEADSMRRLRREIRRQP